MEEKDGYEPQVNEPPADIADEESAPQNQSD